MDSRRYHKASIGEHALKPETLMLGYGYDPALSEGSVKPPVFLTSTFVFQTAEQGRDYFDGRSPRASERRASWANLLEIKSSKPRNCRGSACNP